MPNTLSRQELKRMALIGAQQRLDALRAEMSTILRSFPELARGGKAAVAAAADGASAPAKGGQKRRRRNWNMSDAQKRAVSERMKKYWAGRRKDKASKATKKDKAA
jgi:hypothetical protein